MSEHTKILKALKNKKPQIINERVTFEEYHEIRDKVKQLTNARIYINSMDNENVNLLLETT